MTSAARPTFLPAVGGHSLRDTGAGPITYKSAKELTAHTKLKFRKPEQQTKDDRLDFKKKLEQKEQEYLQKVTAKSTTVDQKLLQFQGLDEDEEDDDESEEDSDEDDEDDTLDLMRELEKIKKERQMEQERIEREKAEAERKEMEERAISGNPLLNDQLNVTDVKFGIKRRWDDDVIFKNQSRDVEDAPKKRFINDMLRSDFHRKFMNKYVK